MEGDFKSITFFSIKTVKQLTAHDFALETREKISLKYEGCVLILFYTENAESKSLMRVWADAARQVAGPLFAACHLLHETEVSKAFAELKNSKEHPYYWAGLRQVPFIMVYRNGWPKAFYNGALTSQAIADFSLELACQADYSEYTQVGAGITVDKNIGINTPVSAGAFTSSQQFTSSIRKTAPVQGAPAASASASVPAPAYSTPATRG